MPYQLIVDGALRDLGDKRYLLSPQDLAAVEELPALLESGVTSFKIEGRLKSPEYVAAVCQVYRAGLDAAIGQRKHRLTTAEKYQLEMTFSRGLFTGWIHGVDHQRLVSARFGKKRGPFVGYVTKIGENFVSVDGAMPVKAGDGIVFDTGSDTESEQGGRVWQVQGRKLFFERHRIDLTTLHPGDRVWKTDDPELNRRLSKSFKGRIEPRTRTVVDLILRGRAGAPLQLEASACSGTRPIRLESERPLLAAQTAPLSAEKLRDHLGRFGQHPFVLRELDFHFEDSVILPIAELNSLRRRLVGELNLAKARPNREMSLSWRTLVDGSEARAEAIQESPQLSVLVRSFEQLDAALSQSVAVFYCDFEDVRRYAEAVAAIRASARNAQVFLATPRIQKAGEQGFFRLIENALPDGVLLRNLGAIDHFSKLPHLRRIGDFSLNVSNPLSAQHFVNKGLERLTVSYDLNAEQVLEMLAFSPPTWFELTLHQHMPMFHMEHCVFAAFLSKGSSHLDCGRPCDRHRVHLRDRIGVEHPLRADVGCRNTLFNAVAQSGASYFDTFTTAGLRHFRVELLEEDLSQSKRIIAAYLGLLRGNLPGKDLWRQLGALSQLGVTRGTLA